MAAPKSSSLPGLKSDDIRTPMITDFLSEDQQQRLLGQIPVGRFCDPEEVAHVVSSLHSLVLSPGKSLTSMAGSIWTEDPLVELSPAP